MQLFWFAHVTNQGLGNRMGCVLTCLLTMESWQPPAVPKWTDLDWVWRLLDLFGKPWNSLRNGKVPQKYVFWVCFQSLSCTTKPTPVGHPFWNQLMAAPKIETNISHIKQRLDPQPNPIGIWWFQPQRMARRRGIHKKNPDWHVPSILQMLMQTFLSPHLIKKRKTTKQTNGIWPSCFVLSQNKVHQKLVDDHLFPH